MTTEGSPDEFSFRDDRSPEPLAQGQAALLLLEALIHGLLDNGTLTKEQAVDAIASATAVKEESAALQKEPADRLRHSIMLLKNMQASIEAHSGTYGTPAPPPGG